MHEAIWKVKSSKSIIHLARLSVTHVPRTVMLLRVGLMEKLDDRLDELH
jgi:hypothetical protein